MKFIASFRGNERSISIKMFAHWIVHSRSDCVISYYNTMYMQQKNTHQEWAYTSDKHHILQAYAKSSINFYSPDD